MADQSFINRLDRVDVPQSIAEGVTPASFGIATLGSAYIAHFVDAIIAPNDTVTQKDLYIVGMEDRQRVDKLFENVEATLTGNLTDNANDFALLKWAALPVGGAGTIAESRTFVDSRKDADGTIVYFIYKGCRAKSVKVDTNKTEYTKIEMTLLCSELERTTVSPFGDGEEGDNSSKANATTDATLTHKDMGKDATDGFVYDGARVAQESTSITIERTLGTIADSGFTNIQYSRAGKRMITGSITMYKASEALQKAAIAIDQKDASIKISASIKFNFTGFNFKPSSDPMTNDDGEPTMESKSIEADGLTFA